MAVLVLGTFLLNASPAAAQLVFSPTKESVREEQLLNALKPGGQQELQGRISIPDEKAATLIRPAGRDWREFHQGTLRTIGAIAVLGMLALLIVFYMVRGRIRIEKGRAGTTLTRFSGLERFAHWTAATCFIILALSGLNVTFGKAVLLPLLGPETFTNLSIAAKWSHNYLAWPFIAALILMFLIWVKDNIPTGADLSWFAQGGGLDWQEPSAGPAFQWRSEGHLLVGHSGRRGFVGLRHLHAVPLHGRRRAEPAVLEQ